VGGIPEVITNMENGILAPAHDYKKLADGVLNLIKNPDLKLKFTGISKEKLHLNFTSKIMAYQTLNEYKSIVDGSV
jgi:glycosyltransferase involved in cell wall biosynthesis